MQPQSFLLQAKGASIVTGEGLADRELSRKVPRACDRLAPRYQYKFKATAISVAFEGWYADSNIT